MRLRIADFAIKHPAIISIILIAVVLFGFIALRSLKQDIFSEVSMPSVVIFTVYPGVGPKDIEREVTNILEDELTTLSGINSISSTSRDSSSIISLQFDWNTDIDVKLPEIREKINNVMADLPEGIEGPPTMLKINVDILPILSLAVESETDRERLSRFVEDQVIPSIARVPGIASINLQGKVSMIADVRLDLNKVEAREISILDIYQALQYNNVSFPAGSVVYRDRELKMRTLGEFSSLSEMENLVVGFRDGSYIRLGDIADIDITERDADVYPVSEGEDAIVIDVMKQQGEDTNRIIADINEVLDQITRDNRGNITFTAIADQSIDIKRAINSVRSSAVLGGILAVVILFLFLRNLRTTLIITVSIPLCVVFAFIALSLRGQSLNIMTLGGLTVSIGMIVDSSIVVLENIHKNFRKNGDAKEAASLGTAEVGGAIIASTSTSLSVFVPMLFVTGFAGSILRDVSWTIVYALGASVFVAIIVVPYLSARLIRTEQISVPGFRRVSGGIEKGLYRLEMFYKRILRKAVMNRVFIIVMAVVILIISVLAFDFVGFEFIPEIDMNEVQLRAETPPGFTLEETKAKVLEIESLVRRLVPEMEEALFYVGQSDSFGFGKSINQAFARIRLVPNRERERDVFAVIDMLQREIPSRIPDVDVTVVNGGLGAFAAMATGGEGFKIEVFGNDLDEVSAAARTVLGIMEQDPNIGKTEMNLSFAREEIVSDLSLDYMGNLGVTPYEAAVTSRIIFNGMETGKYRGDGRSHDILLRSTVAGGKIDRDVLNTISVRSQSGTFVSFANFTDLRVEPSVTEIHHENKMKSVVVTGYLRDPDVRGTSSRVTGKIEEMSLPVGVDWQIVGGTAEMVDSFRALLVSLLVAVFLVYMVMVIQFERFTQPLIVMASIPFTLIGVVAGLLIFGSTLSILSFLGIIALMGIVVNNAIVLIDYINLLRDRDGMDLVKAILEGGSARLKPILMTTLTTILGVLPMAFGLGEGSEIYSPLGQTIAGGLFTSTLITLFLIPVLYYILESRKLKSADLKAAASKEGTLNEKKE
ncbi:MAG: efflux RND transporter permease subunit [Spirochaetia bacterium]